MSHHIRYLHRADALIEATVRIHSGRCLLTPGLQLNSTFIGVIGRALKLNPGVLFHGIVVLSNHFHLLATANDAQVFASFMGHLNGNVSREVGRLRGWRGPMIHRRYTPILVSDEPEAQIARLEYLLSQGCKEGLVDSPTEWPGVHCAIALMEGRSLFGEWVDRRGYWQAKRSGKKVELKDFTEEYRVELAPLPCWAEAPIAMRERWVREIVRRIEQRTAEMHRLAGTRALGAAAVEQTPPEHQPAREPRRPRPLVHAFAREVRLMLIEGYRHFVLAYRAAAELLRSGDATARFPPGCFPPGLPFVPMDSS